MSSKTIEMKKEDDVVYLNFTPKNGEAVSVAVYAEGLVEIRSGKYDVVVEDLGFDPVVLGPTET